MVANKYTYLLTLIIIIFSISCSESTSSSITGNLYGIANLYGQFDESGIKVEIDDENKWTLSDSNGHWALNNLTQGTYTITFSKTGYGEMKYFGYDFIGNGDDYFSINNIDIETVTLYEIPDITIDTLTVTDVPNLSLIKITHKLSEQLDYSPYGGIFFKYSYYDTISSADCVPNKVEMIGSYRTGISINHSIEYSKLKEIFNSNRGWLIISIYGNSRYWNPNINDWFYSALNPLSPDTICFTIPE